MNKLKLLLVVSFFLLSKSFLYSMDNSSDGKSFTEISDMTRNGGLQKEEEAIIEKKKKYSFNLQEHNPKTSMDSKKKGLPENPNDPRCIAVRRIVQKNFYIYVLCPLLFEIKNSGQ